MKEPISLHLAEDEAVYGGKSVQLGAALRKGLPVPPGWALPVDFVAAVASADPEALRTLENFLCDKPGAFAVRSSGVGEDAKAASFAGQHATELNRNGFDDIVTAVRLVWDSGRSESARAYRARMGVTENPRTAVALQKMVFPDCAGVMFTRHPVTGAEEIVIEASWGLGEAIVEGLVVPDRFRLSKDGLLREKQAGTKDIRITALRGGGTEETPVTDPGMISGFCLNDAHLAALSGLAGLCERHFGAGRDIEWGIENETLYLLQCRSITTGAPA
jgi:pyruvate,water dikinase